jgi:hypothetical protein
MFVGAAAVAVGAVLPWISGTIGPISVSKAGTDDGGDGWLFVVGGVLLALAAWQAEKRRAVAFALVICVLLAAMWVYELSDILDRIDMAKEQASDLFFVDVNVGAGMWVIVFGLAISFFGAIAALRR